MDDRGSLRGEATKLPGTKMGMTLAARVEETGRDLLELADAARVRFGGLTMAQLNWNPAPGSWSIAQCFEHLITIQSHYLPALNRLAQGIAKPTAWERYSPLSGFFGRILIRSLEPSNNRRTKTARNSEPPTTVIDGAVIDRFAEHQRTLVDHLRQLPTDLDPKRVIVTSPLASFVTYSLDDCLNVFVVHGRRHFAQAERVLGHADFPTAATEETAAPQAPTEG